jgi:hypothetical protein
MVGPGIVSPEGLASYKRWSRDYQSRAVGGRATVVAPARVAGKAYQRSSVRMSVPCKRASLTTEHGAELVSTLTTPRQGKRAEVPRLPR